jgi:hypothetical protein
MFFKSNFKKNFKLDLMLRLVNIFKHNYKSVFNFFKVKFESFCAFLKDTTKNLRIFVESVYKVIKPVSYK